MTIDERLTRTAATRLSRRHFLSVLGRGVASLGLALAGGTILGRVETAEAGPACCPSPECPGCQAQGSICPVGYTNIGHTPCCLNFCRWTCTKCEHNITKAICYCSHDDLTTCPGGVCGNAPAP